MPYHPKQPSIDSTVDERIAKMSAPALRAELRHYMKKLAEKDAAISRYKGFFNELREHLNVDEREWMD